MRTRFPILALLSLTLVGPAACASSSGTSSGADGGSGSGGEGGGTGSGAIKTVFLILMENNNWSSIYQSSAAPYINSLLPKASWCTNYFDNPAAVHPSEPNYIWLEAGSNLTFTTDADPSASNVSSADHLAKLMTAASVTWRDYAEDISGTTCPLTSTGNYGAKHVPFIFFADVVGNPPDPNNQTCVQHIRPYTQLQSDLKNNSVAQYNFITPNLCDDMHGGLLPGVGCPATSLITQGDTWLSQQIPMIMSSQAYKDNGAIFLTWDESEGGENPIGMIVLSPKAKGNGFKSTTKYFHSSMVRTVEEIFGLSPLLNDAAKQPNLGDLFTSFP
jgi:phosphatidylinositol-3-phosphatase